MVVHVIDLRSGHGVGGDPRTSLPFGVSETPRTHSYSVTIPYAGAPKGSKRHVGNGRMIEASKRVAPFMKQAKAFLAAHPGRPDTPLDCPLKVVAVFYFKRPASHYSPSHGGLRRSAPAYPATSTTGDLDKLERSLYDALEQSGWIANDSRIVTAWPMKRYADDGIDRVEVIIVPLAGEAAA